MNKTLKLFSLLFMLIFSIVSADSETDEDKFRSEISEKYRLAVTEVDPELHCFRLSNRLVCNIPKKDWKAAILPEVGDRVGLIPFGRLNSHRSTHIDQGELRVDIRGPDGLLSKGEVNIWFSGEAEYQLYFVGVDVVCTQPESGWFFSNSVYKEIILLSDGSRWTRKREQESMFTRGDRIIVSPLRENEYLLIDLDQSFGFEASSGKNLVVLSNEVVEPFDSLQVTKE
jgi:hypothetical protein